MATQDNVESGEFRMVPALKRGLAILELFLANEGPLSASEIVALAGVPRTSAHELVQTLVRLSYLSEVAEGTHRFTLGPAVLRLGFRYQMGLDVAREGLSVAERISRDCSDTVHIATLEGTEVLYVAKVDSMRAVRMVSSIGGRLAAHVTAIGKAQLAYLSEGELDLLFPPGHKLLAFTAKSITDPAQFRLELSEVARSGVAFEWEESNPHVACVAAPIRDYRGKVIAAISISTLSASLDDEERRRRTKLVREGAYEISVRLGWLEPLVMESD